MKSNTIHFFKEISNIPRESGNEGEIAQYLCDFAKKRNLFYLKDDHNNVFIRKENGTNEFIILQAHTDMVCEKKIDKEFDFSKDPIEIIEENGYLKANGTSLGADNGIGVAQILSILDNDMKYNIEAIFTSSEETSMDGASNFDIQILKGKKLLNLDGFNENSILIESASFYDILIHDTLTFKEINNKKGYRITLSGLKGGHSGTDIDKNHGNAAILLSDFLKNINDVQISKFSGGEKFNVIPSNAYALIITDSNIKEKVDIFKKNIHLLYPSLTMEIKEENINQVLTKEDSFNFINYINTFKHGVFYSHENKPTTSINLGSVSLEKHLWKVGMRSSRSKEENECLDYLKTFCKKNNLRFELLGYQPGFNSNPNSTFIKKIIEAHPIKLFGKYPNIERIHATVEVGLFKEKCKDLEIAIISPNIKDAHTPNECVEIASIERTDKWIINLLDLM